MSKALTLSKVEAYINSIETQGYAADRFKILSPLFREFLDVDPTKVIVVAGTNGKGSTSSTLATLLHDVGKKVALYTSPHLVRINERIKYDLTDISDEHFVKCFEYVDKFSREHDFSLSHFEYLTFMAAYYFFSGELISPVDYAIFEVGLGGIYDATNVIPHNTCIITKLGVDHTKILGNSLLEIAKNKFGIVNNSGSERQKVIYIPFPTQEICQMAEQLDAELIESCDFDSCVDYEGLHPIFSVVTKYGKAKLSLVGNRACENTALAITAFDVLGFNPEKHLQCLQKVNWPGRMELVSDNPCPTFLSGDHNYQGILSLLDILQYYSYGTAHFLVGIAQDKNHNDMLSALYNLENSRIYITEGNYKPRQINEYGAWLDKCSYHDENWKNALEYINKIVKPNDIIVVTGSLYLIGDVRADYTQKGLR